VNAACPPRTAVWLIDSLRLGGAERLAAAMAAAPPPGWRIELIALQPPGTAPGLEAPGVRQLGARSLHDLRAFWRLLRQLHRLRPALVHAHLTYATVWGVAAARLLRIPVVTTTHVLPSAARGGRGRLLVCLERAARRAAGMRVYVSAAQRAAWGAAADPWARVVANACAPEPAWNTEQRRAWRLRQGFDPVAPVLVTVAVVRDAKGWREWLRAAERILAALPQAHLVWVGGGPDFAALRAAAAASPARDRLHLPGARTDVADWLRGADLFLFPSHGEALPTALLEAMAHGLAVVATDIPANREVLGPAGRYVAVGDAAQLAEAALGWCGPGAAGRQLREQAARAGRERWRQHYAPAAWRDNLNALYAGLVDHTIDGRGPRRLRAPSAYARTGMGPPEPHAGAALAGAAPAWLAGGEPPRGITTTPPRRARRGPGPQPFAPAWLTGQTARPPRPVPGALPRVLVVEFFARGGLFHYSWQLAQALGRRGAEVRFLTGRDGESGAIAAAATGVTPLAHLRTWNPHTAPGRVPPRLRRAWHGALYVAAWYQVLRAVRRERPGVILLGDLEHRCDAWFVRRLRRRAARARPPYVLADIWHNVEAFERNRPGRLVRRPAWRPAMAASFHATFVHGRALAEQFQRDTGRTAHVIAHGNQDWLAAQAGPDPGLARRLALPQRKGRPPIGLLFGSLNAYKGVEVLLDALARIAPARRPLLLIAGMPTASVRPLDWRAQAQRLGLDPWLRWDQRYIPTAEIAWYFHAADWVVLPYRAASQSGVAHLALTFGKPLIVTATGSLAELIDGNGLVVPPDDPAALAQAMERCGDARLRRQMGRRSAELAHTRHGWDQVARNILDTLAPAVPPPSRTRPGHPGPPPAATLTV